MHVPLIGLAGAARSGKDTAAHVLLESGWQRRAFADKVKEFLSILNPWVDSVEDAEAEALADEVARHGWERVKAESLQVRGLLQRCGTEAGRTLLGEDVWVDALFRDFESWGPTVITDVRFPNEAEAIRARGGLVVLIERPGLVPIREAGHISENALAGYLYDDVIPNDGTVDQLRDRVMQLIPPTL
ncbi:deoxynucleotide monophosphate kinase family protein [Streptomyces sp. NPDC000229]|uniref:deoxynucleotide monophosphate kinase family protein n=1 Tax=Streptomyces sp. NPDC000229 TaxID=3154247 RepID=UPI003318BA16